MSLNVMIYRNSLLISVICMESFKLIQLHKCIANGCYMIISEVTFNVEEPNFQYGTFLVLWKLANIEIQFYVTPCVFSLMIYELK